MTGDPTDIRSRLRAILPIGWFPDNSPILDSLLTGFAHNWSWIYSLLQYWLQQARASSASGIWLDLIALDFFRPSFGRGQRETDEHFRTRIQQELLRERATRFGLINGLVDLTGRMPLIFEPALINDTGAYCSRVITVGGLGYNVVGGWGSLQLSNQFFVTVYRPRLSGIASVSGWNGTGGGYRNGSIEYANIALMEDQVSDEQIYRVVAELLPVACTAWTKITN